MKTKLCLCACGCQTVTAACKTISKTKLANMCARKKEKENELKIIKNAVKQPKQPSKKCKLKIRKQSNNS